MKSISEEKINNYKQLLLGIKKNRKKLQNLPVQMFIEPTNRCNLNCEICARHHDPNFSKHLGDINIQLFTKLEKVLLTIYHIFVTGYGEPFVNSDIGEIIKKIKNFQLEAELITNGTLLDDKIIELLVKEKFDAITFSIDALDSELLKKIRYPADIEKILHTIKKINEQKERYNSKYPVLNVAMVLQSQNIDELPKLANYCKENKIRYFSISELSFGITGTYGKYYIENNLLNVKREKLINLFKEVKSLISPGIFDICINVNLDFEKLKEKINYTSEEYYKEKLPVLRSMYCTYPWTTLYISWDGSVKPCCFMANPLGNIKNNSIEKIWNGREFKDLRNKIFKGKIHKNCIYCIQNKFFLRSNEIIEDLKSKFENGII